MSFPFSFSGAIGGSSTPASVTPTLTGANTFTSRTDITQNYVVTISNYSTLNALGGATWASPTTDVGTVSRSGATITVVVPANYEGVINVGIGFTEAGKTQSVGYKSTVASLATSATPVLSGVSTAVEGTANTITIDNYISSATYNITATEGTAIRTGASILWTLTTTGSPRTATLSVTSTEVGKLVSPTATKALNVTLASLRAPIAASEIGNIFYAASEQGDAMIEGYTGNTIKLKRVSGNTTPQAFNSLSSGHLDVNAINAFEPTVDLLLHSVICQKTGTEFLVVGGTVPYRTNGVYNFFGVTRNEADGTLTKTNNGGRGGVLSGGAYLEATGLTIDTTNGIEIHLCFAPETRKSVGTGVGTGVDPYGSNSLGEVLFGLGSSASNQINVRMQGTNNCTFASRRVGGGTDTFIACESHTLQQYQPMVVGTEINGSFHGFRGTGAVDTFGLKNYQALNSAQQTAQSSLGTSCTIRIGRGLSTSGAWSPTGTGNSNCNIKVSSFVVTKSLSSSVADTKFRAKMRARMLYQTQQHLSKSKAEIEALFTANGGDVVYFRDTNPTTKTTAGIAGRVTYEWNQTANNGNTPNLDFAYEGNAVGVKGVRNNTYRNTANTFNGSAPFMHDTLQGTMLAIMDVEDIRRVDGVTVTSPSAVPVDSLAQILNLGSRSPLTLGTSVGYSDKNVSVGLAFHHDGATGVTRVADNKDPNNISSYRPSVGSPTPLPYDGQNQAEGKYPFNTPTKFFNYTETWNGETMTEAKWLAFKGKTAPLPDNHVGANSMFNATRYHTAMMAVTWTPPSGYTLSTVPDATTGQQASCKFYAGTAEGTLFTTPAYGYARKIGNAQVAMPTTDTTPTTTAYLGGIQTGTHLVHAFTKDVLSTDTLHIIAANTDVLLYS